MVKKRSSSREDFDRKIKIIDFRNKEINDKLMQVEERFDRTTEANQLLLECELKEIESAKEAIIQSFQNRSMRFKERNTTQKSGLSQN